MAKTFIVVFSLVVATRIPSQNLIPNPGFELIKQDTVESKGWNFDSFFDEWHTPSESSPDYFSTWQKGPYGSPKNVQGRLDPHTGLAYVGIFANFNHPNPFEYISVKLNKPLIKGELYCLSMFISSAGNHLFSSNEIDYAFSNTRFWQKSPRLFKVSNYKRFIAKEGHIPCNEWGLISSCYKADGGEQYLLIGILDLQFKRFQTACIQGKIDGLYFYIDDVSLLHIKDTSACACNELILSTDYALALGRPLILKNINFETNKADLLPSSDKELNKLAAFLRSNSNYDIEIAGHTDNSGKEQNNLKLSESRARSVGEFLSKLGITSNRIVFKGLGSKSPIKPNDTEENKLMNRRVEIKLIKR